MWVKTTENQGDTHIAASAHTIGPSLLLALSGAFLLGCNLITLIATPEVAVETLQTPSSSVTEAGRPTPSATAAPAAQTEIAVGFEPITLETIDRLEQLGTSTVKGELLLVSTSTNGQVVSILTSEEIAVFRPADSMAPILISLLHPSLPVSMTTNGSVVAIAYESGVIDVWSIDSKKIVDQLDIDGGSFSEIKFHPKGELLAGITLEGVMRIWEIETGRIVGMLNQDELLTGIHFSENGEYFSLLLGEENIEVREMESGERLQNYEWIDRAGPIYWIDFDQNWQYLVWISRATALLEFIQDPEVTMALEHEDYINDSDFSPDGMTLATSSAKYFENDFLSVIHLWDTQTGEEILSIIHGEPATRITFSPDGSLLVTGLPDGGVRAYDPILGEKLIYLPGHQDVISEISFLNEGSILSTISRDGNIRFWGISD